MKFLKTYKTDFKSSGEAKSLEYCSKTNEFTCKCKLINEMYHALNMNLSSKNFEEDIFQQVQFLRY